MSGRFLEEPPRRTEVVGSYDVVVLGGGPSGFAAAVAAGRRGAKVALVEGYGFLGGMATIASVTNFCGLYAKVGSGFERIVRGVVDPIMAELSRAGALREPHSVFGKTLAQAFDNVVYRSVLDELVLDAGVVPHFHTHGVGVVASQEGGLQALLVENRSGRFALEGRIFIDASGDANLCRWAGVPTEVSEALAWPTTMFRLGNVDDDRAMREGKANLPAITAEARASGYALPNRRAYINPQPHRGEWRVNASQLGRDGRAYDCSDAAQFTQAELDGRAQMRTYFRFLRERVPGFENAYLLDVGTQVGVRETRRVVGPTVLQVEDVLAGATFPDVIGCNGWPVEEHGERDVTWTFIEGRGFHDIPLGVIRTSVSNLFVTGRGASLSQRAQASLRVSGPCFVMGQAAGTLAALRVRSKDDAEPSYEELRRALEQDGVFLG